jgi:hypothetical protein
MVLILFTMITFAHVALAVVMTWHMWLDVVLTW